MIQRQISWIQAAFGFYPHPKDQVSPFEDQGWVGYRDHHLPEEKMRQLLKTFIHRDPQAVLHQESGNRVTYRINNGRADIFMKHYHCHDLGLYNPRTYLRLGHARKSFRLHYCLEETEIRLPRVLFYLREKDGGLRSDRLLGTEGIAGSLDLRSWVRKEYPLLKDSDKDDFILRLAVFLACLHRGGILHGDLETNTLLCFEPIRFYLIDLDSVRIFGSMITRDRHKQLERVLRSLPGLELDESTRKQFYGRYELEYGR